MPVVQADVNPLDPTPRAGLEDFEAFYPRQYHAVVRLTYALSGSRLAAEDIAQEAFLAAFSRLGAHPPPLGLGCARWRPSGRPDRPPMASGGWSAGPAAGRSGEGALWVADRGDGSLVRVDPATGRVAARVLLPRTSEQEPYRVAVGDGAIWVTSAGARRGTANLLWRVDPASNQVVGTLDLGPTSAGGIPNSVAAGNGAVWVGGGTKGFIVRLEPG